MFSLLKTWVIRKKITHDLKFQNNLHESSQETTLPSLGYDAKLSVGGN